tara:strand:+ start:1264 stop:1764 length:501 start_codon:yes stop_codon:yes gene_type:complete
MEKHLYRHFSIKRSLLVFWVFSLIGTSGAISSAQGNPEVSNENTQVLKEKISPVEAISKELLPMPLGQIDEAAKKVQISRDPFQDTPAIESSNLDLLKSALSFKGLVKSGDILLAMIQTKNGQELYKVGDSLGNGFFIKGISQKDVTVDISNGFKFYRLSLDGLNK